jgi:hypothetical protein
MQDFERELIEARTPRREDAEHAAATHEAEAARALAAGRPETLRPGAVLHLQRAAGNAGVAQLLGDDQEESPVKGVVGKGGGQPLAEPVRQRMEASFGQDFSDVRVHAGGPAVTSAEAVSARAYTVGNEVVLGSGHEPGSPDHERTMAHELTHVVQQRSGPVDGTDAPGGIRLSSPSDRFEQAAESTAERVMSGGPAGTAPAGQVPVTAQRNGGPDEEEEVQALAIQRQGDEEEEEVQALPIQRQLGEEEEEATPG